MEQNNTKKVRLTLTSKHILPNLGLHSAMYSMFNQRRADANGNDGHADPEEYPEEMNNALQDMLDRDAGFSESEIYDAGEDDLGGDIFDDEDSDEIDPAEICEEIWRRMQELQSLDQSQEDDDVYVFRTIGELRRRYEDGREIIEIAYTEEESMDDTDSVIVYDRARPNAVSICRTGSVVNMLVCEKGVRHISAYKTPIMPFEIAVYTKKCEGGFTFERGGSLELDYMVEVRGADMQRTVMTIDAIVLE